MRQKKLRKRRRDRASEQCITRRGLQIYRKGGQIKTLTGNRWDVASQSTDGVWCRVSFTDESPTCECAYNTAGKGYRCKHIAAVEHALLISSEVSLGKKVDVKEQELRCPECKETRYARDGRYRGKHEERQGRCIMCGRRFWDNLGFECSQVPRLYITLSLMLSGMGMPAANIQMTLRHLWVKVHADTITRILEYYSELVFKHAKTLEPPCVGDKWGCDEKHQKVRGREPYIVAVMDLATQFVLAGTYRPPRKSTMPPPCCERSRTRRARSPGYSLPMT